MATTRPMKTQMSTCAEKESSSKKDDQVEPPTVANDAAANDQQPKKAVPTDPTKNPAAVSLGRLGGLKGGKARARNLSRRQRSDAARKAAKARWQKKKLKK
jgi:hypothetical protein